VISTRWCRWPDGMGPQFNPHRHQHHFCVLFGFRLSSFPGVFCRCFRWVDEAFSTVTFIRVSERGCFGDACGRLVDPLDLDGRNLCHPEV
jgi:hypothetical protein